VDPSALNFQLQKGPSNIMACQLCSGVMCAEALKILLNRGPVYAVPRYHLFDPYYCKHTIGWMPWGNRNPIQQAKLYFMKKQFMHNLETTKNNSDKAELSDMEKILELARWAPSGDNSQPWNFEITDNTHIIINAKDESGLNLYDYNGIPTQMSCGFLIETMRIAATLFSYTMEARYQALINHDYRIEITFRRDDDLLIDPLAYCIEERSVDRRCYERTVLTQQSKAKLAQAVGDEFTIVWLEKFSERYAVSKFTMIATMIRLSLPELYPIHQRVLNMSEKYTNEGMPIKSTGMNAISRFGMKWAMKSWSRVNIMNHLGAIQAAQIELDLLPGIFCGAHFILIPKNKAPDLSIDDYYLRVGRAMQRFWLTVTHLGMVMQPNITPLVLTYYVDNDIAFTKNTNIIKKACQVAAKLHALDKSNPILFLGRIGYPRRPKLSSRSIRKPLASLLVKGNVK
jgi:hypothetical protein